MFSSRLPLSALLELCRSLKHYLGAGLTLVDAFAHQAKRGRTRELAGVIAESLRRGDSLEAALKPHAKRFPPLFLSLAAVGERAGMLSEIFGELERYFVRQQKLRNDFIGRITQFVLAVFVLALLIFFLGQIAPPTPGGKPFDPLGLGLLGGSGALIFLGVVFGTIGGLFAIYYVASRAGRTRRRRSDVARRPGPGALPAGAVAGALLPGAAAHDRDGHVDRQGAPPQPAGGG